ncbi:hypothetical protein BV25DRAFT_1916216 [Artomyces pyxidatus]|uniref:Uncharacterized protein n=1 Tax=Artomyces pyxidatus TaxID=48021 RepID=A0ACB8T258_9AGAM|nr:hypothetical protein BV25DRAFT_1916216 [Artomyces pyxidatus]
MPSLRRTLSSPAVRSSPYPAAIGVAAGRPHGPRRSSGSDTSSRRVLADIDWWRVTVGQNDTDLAEEREAAEGAEAPSPADPADDLDDPTSPAAVNALEIERPSTPIASEVALSPMIDDSPQAHRYGPQAHRYGQLSAFAAGLRTPTRRHSSESSASSVESSPDALLTPRECLSFADMGFADPGADLPPLRARQISLAAVKSLSFSEFSTPTKDRSAKASVFDELAESVYIHDNDIFA